MAHFGILATNKIWQTAFAYGVPATLLRALFCVLN